MSLLKGRPPYEGGPGWGLGGGCVPPVGWLLNTGIGMTTSLALLLLSLVPAQADPAAAAPDDATLVLQGFDVVWKARPHRLSRLAFGALGQAGDDAPIAGRLIAEVRGGSWASGERASDAATRTLRYAAVESDQVHVLSGTTELSLDGRFGRRKGPRESATSSQGVEVALPPDVPPEDVAVWIGGFEMDTTRTHAAGYTPNALGVWLDAPRREGETLTFDLTATLQAAPVPDRRQQLSAYGSDVRVDWVVAWAEGGTATRVLARSSLDEGIEPVRLARKSRPARLPVSADLDPGPVDAVAGLSGFTLELKAQGPVSGRYLRAVTAGLEDARYDPERGTWQALAVLRFANAGQIPRPVRVEAEAVYTVLQIPEHADVRAGRWTTTGGQRSVVAYPEMEPVE